MAYPWLSPPVVPYRGTRGIDDFGAGGFGAPREKASAGTTQTPGRFTKYEHKGLDYLGDPGAQCQFVMDARVWPPSGRAYADGSCNLRSIHLLGEGAYDGLRAVVLYVMPGVADDTHGKRGDPLGTLQDVAAYHEGHEPGKRMSNHCHTEIYELVNGVWVLRDPGQFIRCAA